MPARGSFDQGSPFLQAVVGVAFFLMGFIFSWFGLMEFLESAPVSPEGAVALCVGGAIALLGLYFIGRGIRAALFGDGEPAPPDLPRKRDMSKLGGWVAVTLGAFVLLSGCGLFYWARVAFSLGGNEKGPAILYAVGGFLLVLLGGVLIAAGQKSLRRLRG